MVEWPIIDEAKCDKCGLCVSICKCGILVMENNTVKVVKRADCDKCTGFCATCELVCPRGAITCPFEVVLEETAE